jgi:hypothetical protein
MEESISPNVAINEIRDINRWEQIANVGHEVVRMANVSARTLAIGFAINPITNEGLRFGAFGLAMASTNHNPVVSGLTLGVSTLFVESVGVLASAKPITSDNGNKLLDWVDNKFLSKLNLSKAKMPPVVEAGAVLTVGSTLVNFEKQREDPSITAFEAKKHGLYNASWLAGYFAVEGALLAEGFDVLDSPVKGGLALMALGGILAASKRIKHKIKNNSQTTLEVDVEKG